MLSLCRFYLLDAVETRAQELQSNYYKMKTIQKIQLGAILVGSLILMCLFVAAFVPQVKASASFFLRKSTNVNFSTTTTAFMSAGAATTTLVFDLGAGGAQAAESAVLLQQFVGSTTAAVMLTTIEYSQGTPGVACDTNQTACDWYASTATSTTALGIQPGGAGFVGSTTRSLINIVTPTKYVRAVFTIPATSVNGAVYAEFVARRQSN